VVRKDEGLDSYRTYMYSIQLGLFVTNMHENLQKTLSSLSAQLIIQSM